MNNYRQWLTELAALNQQLYALAVTQRWQELALPAAQYLQLAATPPASLHGEKQLYTSEAQALLAAHQQLTQTISEAMRGAGDDLSHGFQQQKLLKAYFSV